MPEQDGSATPLGAPDYTPQDQWIDAESAMKQLGYKTPRTLLKIVARHPEKLRAVRRKSPESGQNVTYYHAGDIARMVYEKEHPEVTTVPVLPKLEAQIPPPPLQIEAADPGANESEPDTDGQPWDDSPWDTIPQAAIRYGVSQASLIRLAEGCLYPKTFRDLGKGASGGQWRVLRVAKPTDELF